MDTFDAMRAFVRVVDSGSLSAAARSLGRGQPAVSKTIAALEARIGGALLLRNTRALTLTDAGQVFYDRARLAVDAADEAEAAARGASAALSGRLRVSAPVTFARLHIIPKLGDFLERHPALELDLVLDDRVIDLVEEGMDLALRAGPLADSSLVAVRLGECERLVAASPAYLAAGEPLTPDDLEDHRAILYGEARKWSFTREGRTRQASLRPGLRVSALEGVREAAAAGLGLAIASRWSFADLIAEGRLTPVLQDWTLPPVDLWAVSPAGRRSGAKARAFVEFVRGIMP